MVHILGVQLFESNVVKVCACTLVSVLQLTRIFSTR